jgi:hypothetical protein
MVARNVKYFSDESHPWVQSTPFKDIQVQDLLSEAIKKVESGPKSSKSPVFVIDIDSTLLGLGKRLRSIFMSYIRSHPKPPLWAHKAIPHMEPFNHHYSLGKALSLMVPKAEFSREGFQEEFESFFGGFKDFWENHFFSDRHLHFDEAYPGAVEFVNSLEDHGIGVVYLTGRDRPRTGQGTLNSLKKLGFKMGENYRLLMKPTPTEFDVVFKKRAIEVLVRQHQVLAMIDNEPENLVMFARHSPHSEIVFFHSIMSPRVPEENIQKYLNGRKVLRLKNFD